MLRSPIRTWACPRACVLWSAAGSSGWASVRTDPDHRGGCGRTFDVELLGLLVEDDEEELLDALDRGLQASLLVESPARVGRFNFAHALINHALCDAVGGHAARPASSPGGRRAGAAMR